MPDLSHLDSRYFVDETTFNCPFCNRRNVYYIITGGSMFDWSDRKKAYVYFVKCRACNKTSMHLSYDDIAETTPPPRSGDKFIAGELRPPFRFRDDIRDLDNQLFYSVPTSFFALNTSIPTAIRELYAEAEGCLKSNFLTGASACARKIVYELAKAEGAGGNNYEGRIKSLKEKFPSVDGAYFDTLFTVQKLTGNKVHEEAYDGWEAKHLRAILSVLKDVLAEIYVYPSERAKRRTAVLAMETELKNPKKKEESSTTPDSEDDKGAPPNRTAGIEGGS